MPPLTRLSIKTKLILRAGAGLFAGAAAGRAGFMLYERVRVRQEMLHRPDFAGAHRMTATRQRRHSNDDQVALETSPRWKAKRFR